MADSTTKFAIFRADLSSSRWSEVRSVGDDTAHEGGNRREVIWRVTLEILLVSLPYYEEEFVYKVK
jgi:hypothetical protein